MSKTPKFKNLDEFLSFLPPDELQTTQYLRELISDCIPNCREKLSYNVPYFYGVKSICFVWPGSVLWGGRRIYDGVRLGLTRGHLLTNDLGYFNRGDRKFVIHRDFGSVGDIDTDMVRMYLLEAAEIDAALKH